MSEVKNQIDWQRIYKQLADYRRVLNDRCALDGIHAQQRLQQRAEQLARRSSGQRQNASRRRVFVFVLGQQRFAFDLGHIAKVVRLENCVPVPGGPPCLLGVGNIEGEVRSILDLRTLLGIEKQNSHPAYALLLRWRQTELGVAADAVEEVTEFDEEQIRQPEEQAADALKWSLGIGPEATVLLDADKLLADGVENPSLN